MRRLWWLIWLTLLALDLPEQIANAQGLSLSARPDPTVSPSRNAAYFDYLVTPGDQFSDALLLTNVGAEPLALILYTADGVTASNGGIAFPADQNTSPSRAGAWLQLATHTLTLPPGESQSVVFSVIIPADTTVQQAAGIIVQPAAAPPTSAGQFGVTVVQRTAVTVLFSLPGATQADLTIVELTSEDDSEQTLVAHLLNQGNVGLKPGGALTLTPVGSQAVVQEIPVRLGFLLPGDQIEYRLAVDPPLPAGSYAATLRLTYAGGIAQRAATVTLGAPVTTQTAGAPPEVAASAPDAAPVLKATSLPAPAADSQNQPVPIALTWALIGAAVVILLLVGVVILQARRLRGG